MHLSITRRPKSPDSGAQKPSYISERPYSGPKYGQERLRECLKVIGGLWPSVLVVKLYVGLIARYNKSVSVRRPTKIAINWNYLILKFSSNAS